MTRTRLGLLGLSVMVFGLTAFASTAQAETGAKWLFAEKAPNSGLVAFLEAEIGLEAETTGILHTEIAKVKVLFECTTISIAGNPKLKANGSIGVGRIKFSGCITKLNGVTSSTCTPKSGGIEKGVIVTLELHGLIILHTLANGEKDDLISILPINGEIFSHMELGEECAIGENILVLGKVTLKDCENLALTHLVKHLLEVGPLAELSVISKTPEHAATILGSAWAFLTGAHSGFKFSGDPA